MPNHRFPYAISKKQVLGAPLTDIEPISRRQFLMRRDGSFSRVGFGVSGHHGVVFPAAKLLEVTFLSSGRQVLHGKSPPEGMGAPKFYPGVLEPAQEHHA